MNMQPCKARVAMRLGVENRIERGSAGIVRHARNLRCYASLLPETRECLHIDYECYRFERIQAVVQTVANGIRVHGQNLHM